MSFILHKSKMRFKDENGNYTPELNSIENYTELDSKIDELKSDLEHQIYGMDNVELSSELVGNYIISAYTVGEKVAYTANGYRKMRIWDLNNITNINAVLSLNASSDRIYALVNANDVVLVSKTDVNFKMTINLEDYPTATKLYVSENSSYVTTIKASADSRAEYIQSLDERITDLEDFDIEEEPITTRKNNTVFTATVGEKIVFTSNGYRSVVCFDVGKYQGKETYLKIDSSGYNKGDSSHLITVTDDDGIVLMASNESRYMEFLNISLYPTARYVYMTANGNDGVITSIAVHKTDRYSSNAIKGIEDHLIDNLYGRHSNFTAEISSSITVGSKIEFTPNGYRKICMFDVKGFTNASINNCSYDKPSWVVTDFNFNVLEIGGVVYHDTINLHKHGGKASFVFAVNNEGLGKTTLSAYSRINGFSDSSDNMSYHTENPIEFIKESVGMTASLRTFAVIGDSLSSGAMDDPEYGNNADAVNYYDYSWMQYMARLCGAKKAYNFSRGGETTLSWWNWDGGATECAKHHDVQAYYIALGVNDCDQTYDVGNFDTDVDLSDYTQNAETFIGMYAKIIQYIRTIKPNCYVFVVTIPNNLIGNRLNSINDAIRLMAQKFERCYLIDLAQYAPSYKSKSFTDVYYLNTHMSPMGYLYTAYMIANYTDWIIRKYPDEFKHLWAVGTDEPQS